MSYGGYGTGSYGGGGGYDSYGKSISNDIKIYQSHFKIHHLTRSSHIDFL
jgi:hypothetical protein